MKRGGCLLGIAVAALAAAYVSIWPEMCKNSVGWLSLNKFARLLGP